MAALTLKGNEVHTTGDLPIVGTKAPGFTLIGTDLSDVTLNDFKGTRLVMNIFPSVDTSTCAASIRRFNEKAAGLNNTRVLCISRDLPFAQKRFCVAEGIVNVEILSDFKDGSFGKSYGLEITNGKLAGLHSRAVIVVDEAGNILHSQHVSEIADEPDYEAALSTLIE